MIACSFGTRHFGHIEKEGILGILGRKEVSATSENVQVRPIVRGQRGQRRKRRRRVGRGDSIQPFHNENDVNDSLTMSHHSTSIHCQYLRSNRLTPVGLGTI